TTTNTWKSWGKTLAMVTRPDAKRELPGNPRRDSCRKKQGGRVSQKVRKTPTKRKTLWSKPPQTGPKRGQMMSILSQISRTRTQTVAKRLETDHSQRSRVREHRRAEPQVHDAAAGDDVQTQPLRLGQHLGRIGAGIEPDLTRRLRRDVREDRQANRGRQVDR